jgi:hypothetical protein
MELKERPAIFEFDAGFTRREAERHAQPEIHGDDAAKGESLSAPFKFLVHLFASFSRASNCLSLQAVTAI